MNLNNAKKYEFDECFVIPEDFAGGDSFNPAFAKKHNNQEPVTNIKAESKMFSEEEMNKNIQKEVEKVKENVKQEIANSSENRTNDILEKICTDVGILLEKQEKELENILKECVKLTYGIIVKLLPKLARSETLSNIEKLISNTLNEVSEEKKVSIIVASDVFSDIKKKIDDIKKCNGFEGNLVVMEDSEMASGNCNIEWSNGGVIKDMEKVYQQIDKVIDEYTSNIGE